MLPSERSCARLLCCVAVRPCFCGMAWRMENELAALPPASAKTKSSASPKRKHSVKIDRPVLASLSTFPKRWISREESEEIGPSIVRQKCG